MKTIYTEWVEVNNPRTDKVLIEAGAVLIDLGYMDFAGETFGIYQLRIGNIDGRLFAWSIQTHKWKTPRYPTEDEVRRAEPRYDDKHETPKTDEADRTFGKDSIDCDLCGAEIPLGPHSTMPGVTIGDYDVVNDMILCPKHRDALRAVIS